MIRSLTRLTLVPVLVAVTAATAATQTAPPSPQDVLGYTIGERFTDYNAVRQYALSLADASPLVEYRAYGTTPEHRELFQLVFAAPRHRQRLDAILSENAELARPETSESRAREIATRNPAVVYLSYGVHGNESASSEAALWTAWDLARGAEALPGVLDSLIVVMEPVVNPDGRDRYVQWYRSVVGAEPNPDPQAREHREPWPGGRYNHYLFDLNRDWAWMTQPETRARLATWPHWNPVVHVDFHEMGYNSSYFFFPAAAPINPIYPEYVLEWGRRFGEGNARALDALGQPYFTGDNYDLFYPGYGDSWPALLGAIGMTYEQGGSGVAGLAIERAAGDTLTLRERATNHWTTGLATLRTAANGKTSLLLDYAAAQRAVGRDEPDVLLVPGADTTWAGALVAHLLEQGIEVERAERSFRAGATAYPGVEARREFPAGTYRVRARQARGRLATTLLQPRTFLDAEHSYDISAWSLPYAYGVEAHQARSTPAGGWSGVAAATPAAVEAREPGYGYLIPPGTVGAQGVAGFLRAGGRARVLTRPATFAGREWPRGTWFLPARGNERLREMTTEAGLGAIAVPVATGLAEAGSDLGSSAVVPVELPRVAVVSGDGISPLSFGAHWFFLEQMAEIPFTAVLSGDLARTDLAEYDVVVLPDASGQGLTEAARTRLADWVRGGGRLIAVGGGARLAANLFEIALREPAEGEPEIERFLRGREEREREEWVETVPGAILPVRVDPAHPVTWGAPRLAGDLMFVLHSGTLSFEPAENVEPIAYFPADLEATSGVISEANLDRLEQSVWLAGARVGAGRVILFAQDPLFRLFWKSAHPLYLNALLVGGR